MTSTSGQALTDLCSWHHEQSPLVRALVEPMVDELSAAFSQMQRFVDDLQGVVDDRDAELCAAIESHDALVAELRSATEGHDTLVAELRLAANARDALNAELQAQLATLQAQLATPNQGPEKHHEHPTLGPNEKTLALIAELTSKLEVAVDHIAVLERKVFGRQGEGRRGEEKTPDARKTARRRRRKDMTDDEKKKRRAAREAKRRKILDALRTVKRAIKLPPELADGRGMPPLISTVYEWRPGELVRIEVSRQRAITPSDLIVTAPPIEQVVEGGIYGPALYAKIAVDKCLNAMPLRRQERAFKRLGAPLPVSTLCALFHRAGELVKPIYDALLAHVASAPHVQADETPMPVLDEHATRKGWMWVFATGDALLFTHSPSRGKGVPERVLGDTTGTLTVDGYTAYHSVTGDSGRNRGGCWCHARRGLYNARKHDEAFIAPLLDQIGELFFVEEVAEDRGICGTPEHLALRTEKSAPLIAKLFAALRAYDADATDARASVTKAVRYILNQREPLMLFLRDAAVPIHNNLSERALRIIALMRKNALFAGTDEAAQRFAQLLSLLGTCNLHGVNPEVWLADVLIAISEPGLVSGDLLPWNWKRIRGPTCRPYFDTT